MRRFSKRTNRHSLRIFYYRLRKNSKKELNLLKNRSLFKDYFKILAPETFDIEENNDRKRLINFLNKIKDNVNTKKILLNFKRTKRMITCGTILFLAEIRTIYQKYKNPVISCILSSNPKVNQVLKQIGFFNVIRFGESIKPHFADVVNWKFTHGSIVLGEKYDAILEQYDNDIRHRTQEGLYIAFTEAMKNTQQHAYLEEDKKILSETWWAFSQLRDNRLVVVFCDLGMGICNSLNRDDNQFAKTFKKVINWTFSSESSIIEEIIKFRKTRTKLPYRGKGLGQLCGVVENSKNGKVLIYSNHGVYCNLHNESADYRHPIPGTIIQWSLDLDAGDQQL